MGRCSMDQHLLLIADFDGDDDDEQDVIILCPNCGCKHWQIDTFTYAINGVDTGMSSRTYTCLDCGYEESAYHDNH